jgi:hypothetical protein
MTYITIKASPSTGASGGFPWFLSVNAGGTGAQQGAAGSDQQVQFNDSNVLAGNAQFTYDKSINTLTAGNINVVQASTLWGNIQAGNINLQPGSLMYAGNVTATTKVETPQLYANTITDGGFAGTGNIQVNAANVFASGNIIGTGNITGGNLRTAGLISSTGNITGGNLRTGGSVSATGNVIGAGIYTGGDVSAAGNIIGVSLVGSVVSVSGNITGGNITTTGISNLGSLNTYNEAQYTLPTSGSITISKLNGQVQYLGLTGNVTSISLTNFVTSQGGVNQSDTVTLIIKQGATPYTVTMPTNSAIKYAGNVTSVGTTANSVTMASISAANVGGAALYLITVSPEFV